MPELMSYLMPELMSYLHRVPWNFLGTTDRRELDFKFCARSFTRYAEWGDRSFSSSGHNANHIQKNTGVECRVN
jgi:hypothetical protein